VYAHEKKGSGKRSKLRIKDIAKLANVSTGTVDRVLHKRGEVSEETRERILQIINEQNYEPNLIARTLASKKVLNFASFLPFYDKNNYYWEAPHRGIQKAVEEITHYGVAVTHFNFDQFDSTSFAREARRMMDTKPDAVLLAPAFYNETLQLADECNKARIPYIFVDSNLPGPHALSFIGQDSFQSGYVAGKLMDYAIDEDSTILIVKIAYDDGNINLYKERQRGFISYFSDKQRESKFNFIVLDIKENNDSVIFDTLQRTLPQVGEVKGIFVTNSKVYKIAKFLQESNLESIHIIGYDLVPDNVFYLKNNIIDFLIGQRPERQGYNAVMTAFNHLFLSKPVQSSYYSPIDIITQENVDYYLSYEL